MQNVLRGFKIIIKKLLKTEQYRLKALAFLAMVMVCLRTLIRNRQMLYINHVVWSYAGPKTIY